MLHGAVFDQSSAASKFPSALCFFLQFRVSGFGADLLGVVHGLGSRALGFSLGFRV